MKLKDNSWCQSLHLRRMALVGIGVWLLLVGRQAAALDLGSPNLSQPKQQEQFFAPERLRTSAGLMLSTLSLEPQLGLGYDAREVAGGGLLQTTHKLQGEAGGKLNLLENVSLLAVARIPLYRYEMSGQLPAVPVSAPATGRLIGDILRPGGNTTLHSELGLHLGRGVDLNIFYDQSLSPRGGGSGGVGPEERFGTHFIIRFR